VSLDPSVRTALRQVLEAAAPLTGGARLSTLAPPVRRVFLVRSGSAAMLREALDALRRIVPLPHLCVLGRAGDDAVLAQAWPGAFELFVVPGDRDYAWAALADRADVAAAIGGCSHHGFLARGVSAAGYENVFEIFAACGVTSCFAVTVGGSLVRFDLQADGLRRASTALCEAIVDWTCAHASLAMATRAAMR
jgi:hypothetical protein